jgi:hypothetical protein
MMPVAVTQAFPKSEPKFSSLKNGSLRIRNREFVSTVTGSTTGPTVRSNVINPNNPLMFPFLTGIAKRFDLYRFRRLVFHYGARCATTQTGTFIMAIDFDTRDNPPGSLADALVLKPSANEVIWKSFSLSVKDKLGEERFVHDPAVPIPNGTSLTDYFVGVLITYQGTAHDISDKGFLSVEYDVELSKPENALGYATVDTEICFRLDALTPITAPTDLQLQQHTNITGPGALFPVSNVWSCPRSGLWRLKSSALTSATVGVIGAPALYDVTAGAWVYDETGHLTSPRRDGATPTQMAHQQASHSGHHIVNLTRAHLYSWRAGFVSGATELVEAGTSMLLKWFREIV